MRARRSIEAIGTALLDLVFPRRCAGCGCAIRDEPGHVCWDCLAGFQIIEPPYCSRCGDPVEGCIGHAFLCSACLRREPHFDRARSAARFRGPLMNVLHHFKYSGGTFVADDLVRLLQACVETHFADVAVDAVAFVPLYPAKERDRTYNQARLLAAGLARRLGAPLARGCLARVRPTATQTRLTALERAENMKDAFQARAPEWLEGRRVLLVDDVMTTGATVNECARALKAGGAARVYVATVARG